MSCCGVQDVYLEYWRQDGLVQLWMRTEDRIGFRVAKNDCVLAWSSEGAVSCDKSSCVGIESAIE